MKKLIRYWNQNRLKIIITVIIIVFIIILIQAINQILENTRVPESAKNETIVDTSRPSESVITGEEIPKETADENVEIIKQFVNYCNAKDYNKAYELLTDDCKNKSYNSLDLFVSNYCNKVFNTQKAYNLELWYYTANTYTYRVTYIENNILETGNISSGNNIEDYITIVDNENGRKINISGLIEKRTINKGKEQDGIQILVNDRFMYKDLEEYVITVKNNTDKTILLSEGTNSNDICLIDSNEIEYNSILNEVPLVNLELKPGIQKTFNIRFYKMYNLYRPIESISFKNIIMDKESYEKYKNNIIKINMVIDI